jgi:hypothetical protein
MIHFSGLYKVGSHISRSTVVLEKSLRSETYVIEGAQWARVVMPVWPE